MNLLKLFLLFIVIPNTIFSQTIDDVDYSSIDNKALEIPYSKTENTKDIADYFNSQFRTDSEKVRAVFIWVASTISYDLKYSSETSENRDHKILRALKTKKGICQNYAALFTDICNKMNVKSYVVEGYTKQNQVVSRQSHAWSASLIDGVWFLYDPTWGSGYVMNGQFEKQINSDYFQQNPNTFITTHMPFDYLWQFLEHPISNKEFYEGKRQKNSSRKIFSFTEVLKSYENKDESEKLKETAIRIEKNGISNFQIAQRLSYIHRAIDKDQKDKVISLYNSAAAHYNDAIIACNVLIDFRNNNYKLNNSESFLQKLLKQAENNIGEASSILMSLPAANSKTTTAINRLRKSIIKANTSVERQKLWLKNYLKENEMRRISSFSSNTVSYSRLTMN